MHSRATDSRRHSEQNTRAKQHTLNPSAVRLQEGLGKLLYGTYLDTAYVIRFDFNSFMKGDPSKTAAYPRAKIECEAAMPNEWRALDDENPLPDGGKVLESVQFYQQGQPAAPAPDQGARP
jgi:hypothetical protein